VDIAQSLTLGRRVPANMLLAVLVDDSQTEVLGYIQEADLTRVNIDGEGKFYADQPEFPPIDLRVIDIDRSNIKTLEEPYNASLFGGGIAAQNVGHELVPLDAIYRLRMRLTQEQQIELPHFVRGQVRLKAESVSLLKRFWNLVTAVVIRESGF